MSFKSLSCLLPAERVLAESLLNTNPIMEFYWATSIEDLTRGIDNRLIHLAKEKAGVIFGIAFSDVTVFSFCGKLSDSDIASCAEINDCVELHVLADDVRRCKGIFGRRFIRKREMILMTAATATKAEEVTCRDLSIVDAVEVKTFYHHYYPESVFDVYMLSMPFVGIYHVDKLVACAGTIALSKVLRTALIGHFLTAPEARNLGLGQHLGSALLDRLARRGFVTVYLATTNDNIPALRLYKKLGFVTIDQIVQINLMP